MSQNKDIFTLFDKKGQGSIPKDVVGDYLRAIGYNPTNKQVTEILSGSGEALTLPEVEELVKKNEAMLDATTRVS